MMMGKGRARRRVVKFCVPNPQNFVHSLFTRSHRLCSNINACVCTIQMSELVEIMIIL